MASESNNGSPKAPDNDVTTPFRHVKLGVAEILNDDFEV